MTLKLNQRWVSKSKSLKLFLTGLLAAGVLAVAGLPADVQGADTFWPVQSIDTMKYSRDLSREKLVDPAFDDVIDQQVGLIAAAGATHVSIGTPYDEEFWPMLERWVAAARRHDLNVWFRGNWSGWERWFGYGPIDRAAHIRKTDALIRQHKEWFADGDIFTACPECENGGPGDPRRTGDTAGHRQFLIDEFAVTEKAFEAIGRDVRSNFHSMNGDVARLIMDRETTAALGGVVTVDHYVGTPERLVQDLVALGEQSGGKVVLGEFGAPIPDIHGRMTDQQQSRWIAEALEELAQMPNLIGVNYWLSVGGSTQLWDAAGEGGPSAAVVGQYFRPEMVSGVVQDELGRPLAGARVTSEWRDTETGRDGAWRLPFVQPEIVRVDFGADGYDDRRIRVRVPRSDVVVTLDKTERSIAWRLLTRLAGIFS